MKWCLIVIGRLINLLWCKLLYSCGYEFDESVIPKDTCYCYTPDDERNKDIDTFKFYYIIPCPYYVYLGKLPSRYGMIRTNGCKYYGEITNDMTFNDQCKMCGINYPNYE